MTVDDRDERDPDTDADEVADEGEADSDFEDDDTSSDDTDTSDDEEDAALGDEEDEDGQASLEELLAQRAAGRKTADETDDTDDIMALASEPDEPIVEALPTQVDPIKEQKEFVCQSCYLVKPRVQLADEKRMYCRDCV